MKKLLLLFVGIALTAFSFTAGAETIKNKTFIDDSYKGVTAISAAQTALPVRISAGNTGRVTVKCHVEKMTVNKKNFRITARMNGSTLEIRQEPREGLSFNNVVGYLEITVPAGVKTVSIATVSGSVRAEGFSLEKYTVNTVSGSIAAQSLSVAELAMNSTSGSIRLSDISASAVRLGSTSGSISLDRVKGDKAGISTTSGSIRLKDAYFAAVNLNSVSGSLTAYLGERIKQVNANTVSGSVSLFFKKSLKNNDYNLNSTSGSIRIEGLASARRQLRLGSGNGDVNVQANTVSGSISVREF